MNSGDAQAARDSAGGGWRRPQGGVSGLERYYNTVRERLGLIALVTLVTTLVAAGYLVVATDKYRAEADLLVIPASRDDPSLSGLPLIRESSDPTRDVETAARLVTSRNVARRVDRQLGLPGSTDDLLKKVTAEPVAQSNVVAVTAVADSPELARDIANGFANGVVAQRSEVVRAEADKLIDGLQTQVQDAEEAGQSTDALSDKIAALQQVKQSGDPTMTVETQADIPSSPFSPRPMLTLLAGIFGGLILGVGGAFASSALDPRLRREEQLRELYSLPILARVP
jgi:capsular polysaccharide biosynthesis protein